MPGTDYLDEIDVGAFGEAFVVAYPASASDDVHGFEVVREFDVVGNARIEEPVSVAPVDPFDVDHSQLYGASQPVDTKQPGFVDAVRRVEPLDVAADAQVMGKQGEAAASVAAHLARRAVGVVVAHRTVAAGYGGSGERHQTVGSDAEMTVAQGCDKFRTGCEAAFAVVDQDEVVACSFVFCKCRLHFLNGYVLAKIVKLLKVLLIL